MKQRNLLIFLIGLLLGGGGGFLIGKNYGHERRGGSDSPEILDASTARIQSAFRSGEPVNYNDAKILYDTYTQQWNGNAKYRTRSLWYNYHNIYQYLTDLAKELASAGYDTSRVGIRAYIGSLPDVIDGYKFRLTTFIVPTIMDADGKNKRDTLDKSVESPPFLDKRDKLIWFTDGFNHGDLCPPETTCGKTIF